MTKPISNAKFKRMVMDMSSEDRQTVLQRHLRITPIWIKENRERKNPSQGVEKHLTSHMKLVQKLWVETMVERHCA